MIEKIVRFFSKAILIFLQYEKHIDIRNNCTLPKKYAVKLFSDSDKT